MQKADDAAECSPPVEKSGVVWTHPSLITFFVGVALFGFGSVAIALAPIGIFFLVFGVVFSLIGGLTFLFRKRGAELRPHHVVENAVGLLFIFFFLLRGFYPASRADLILLGTGIVLLVLGCFPWAYKLPSYVALLVGGTLLVVALAADVSVPLIFIGGVGEGPRVFANTVHLTLGVPGIILILAGVWRIRRWPMNGPGAADI